MSKAYAYLRVSSDGQVQGHGFDRQIDAINEYAHTAGFDIAGVYRDHISGTSSQRPAFEDMMAEILSNGVRVVIVESLDRLARELMIQLQFIALLRGRGVSLISAATGEDVTQDDDPMRIALTQVQGVFAELDKRTIVKKLAKARAAKRATNGKCEGRKRYGEIDPEEKRVVAYIKQLRRKPRMGKRLSTATICDILNAEGIPPRSGVKWHPTQITRILNS